MELELFQPKTRYECPDCHKHFSHLERCRDRDKQGRLIRRCKHCKNKLVTNIFYVPLKERKNLNGTIGKFSLNELEKEELHDNFVRQGLDSIRAWNKVHYHIWLLRRSYGRWKGRQTIEKNRKMREEQEIINQKKQFLEGLNG